MVTLLVGAANAVAHDCNAAIRHDLARKPDGSDVASLATQRLDDFFVAGEAEFADNLLRLDFVQVMIAAQQQQDEFGALALLGHHGDCLYGLRQRQIEEGGDVLAPGLARGGYLFHSHCATRDGFRGRNGLGQFHIGRVVRCRAEGDRIFPGVGEDMKLVRTRAANGAGIGRHSAELQAQPGEDAAVGVEHIAVFAFQIGIRGVEGIAVLHQELASAHDAEARAYLVAELGLDLVEMAR